MLMQSAPTQFKVGDRVELLPELGRIQKGVVTLAEENGPYLEVKWDDDPYGPFSVHASNVQLIQAVEESLTLQQINAFTAQETASVKLLALRMLDVHREIQAVRFELGGEHDPADAVNIPEAVSDYVANMLAIQNLLVQHELKLPDSLIELPSWA